MTISKMIAIGVAVFAVGSVASATMECKGKDKDAKVSISILDLASRKVKEGQKNPVAVRVVEVDDSGKYPVENVLYAGVVSGVTEDVQWFLKSKDKKSLVGTIFMDELYDFSLTVNDREISFNCEE